MTKNLTTSSGKRRTINRCEITTDTITGRGGLRYLEAVSIFPHFERLFGSIRKNRKGIDIAAKIVKHSGHIILKVTQVVWDDLGFAEI